MIQILLNKTTPHFQLLPMSKVDQLRIYEVPPFQLAKNQGITGPGLQTIPILPPAKHYSKTCVKRPLSKTPKMVFKTYDR